MDLVPPNLRAEVNAAMKNIFDTFHRTSQITVYKKENNTITIKDPLFNADWGMHSNNYENHETDFAEVEDSFTFSARVWYGKLDAISNSFRGEENFNIKARHDWSEIKIQVEEEARDILVQAERVEFEGEIYQFVGDLRRIGLLKDFYVYQFVLGKVN